MAVRQEDRAGALLGALVAEAREPRGWRRDLEELPAGRRILGAPPDVQVRALTSAVAEWDDWPRQARPLLRQLARRVLRRGAALDEGELRRLAEQAARRPWALPLSAIIGAVERSLAGHPPSPPLAAALSALRGALRFESSGYVRALAARIERLLEGGTSRSARLLAQLDAMEPGERAACAAGIDHARAMRGSLPSAKWLGRAAALARDLGDVPRLARWLELAAETGRRFASPMLAADGVLLAGLVWIASTVDDPAVVSAMGTLGEECLRKVVGHGPVSARVANACIRALARSARPEAVVQLSRLRVAARYAVPRRLVDAALRAAAERAGTTVEDLEESTVPTFGIRDGVLRQEIGRTSAELRIDERGAVKTLWRRPGGAPGSSVPAELERDHAAEIASVRRTAREIRRTLAAQRRRLERIATFERVWTTDEWTRRHLNHPLLATIARRLVWEIVDGATVLLVAWDRGRGSLVDVAGRTVRPAPGARVRLWHPIRSDRKTTAAWRRWLDRRGVKQPFPQAHRAVYRPTDAERGHTASHRFTGFILYQHQLAVLFRQRGWRYGMTGVGFETTTARAVLELEPWRLRAELEVTPVEDLRRTSAAGAWFLVRSGPLVFRTFNGPEVRLADVPSLVFSEVVRAVVQFVEVATVAAEARTAAGGDQEGPRSVE